MAARNRTQKDIAKRHDLNYFKKGSPIRLWQWRLAGIALVLAVVWLSVSSWRSANAFSAGPISEPHAVFGQRCELCHVPVIRGAGWLPVIGARRKVPDSACMSCHNVGPHHAGMAAQTATCSSCHVEHMGATHLAAAPVRGCTQCHANLETSGRPPQVAAHIVSFTQGHPDFRPLLDTSANAQQAAFGLKFNHQAHLEANLRKPDGSTTTLQCASCHIASVGTNIENGSGLAAVDFDRSCRTCHSLDFDTRVKEQAPHADSAAVLQFVQARMAAAAPNDQPALIRAETIVFRDKCSLCHTVSGALLLPRALDASLETPAIAPFEQPKRFFSQAIFSHAVHSPISCEECHAAALGSTSGKDLLLPGITTCQRCHDGWSDPQHAPPVGHAESGCSLCHTFHEGDFAGQPADHAKYTIDHLVSLR